MIRKKLLLFTAAAAISLNIGAFGVSAAEESVTVEVLSVDGDKVTAQVGELSQSEGMPGEVPEKPEGEAPQDAGQGNPPDMPQGDVPLGMGMMTFTEGEEEITFQITDATEITLEFLQGTGEGTLEDIAEGAVLEIELDENQNAEKILVKNLNKGGGFGGSSEVTNGTSANTMIDDGNVTDAEYTSDGDDENALRVDGAKVNLTGITVKKEGGESSNTENGDFYGQNAGLLALNGADVTISGAEVTTDAVNGNGVFSYGEGTTVTISDSVISTSQRNSGGIQTTGGGTMNADRITVHTKGDSAAAIRSDRGGGTVNVTGGSFTTEGSGSPAIYCTADIHVADALLTAKASEGVVVEGKNSVRLTDCTLKGSMAGTYNGDAEENIHGVMIYQSMSGDAEMGEAEFSAKGGSIETTTGDLFYVTNTTCGISLENVELKTANDVLLRAAGNNASRGWGTAGANGGKVTLKTSNQILEGNIIVDDISSLSYTMSDGTEFTGAINPDGEAGQADIVMEAGAVWTLTGDSYISSFDGDLSQVHTNGYQLYVNGEKYN